MPRTGLLSALLVIFVTDGASANTIDGQWCSPNNERMTVQGTRVTTPAGQVVTARATRHHVDYEIPDGERHAGGRIWAEQVDEITLRVTVIKIDQQGPGDHDDWTRCGPTS